ncbi:hypothetical protein FXO37_27714 [Capsicum annuum]|nr:hypothetical protein FXO37_27714 [Capsicum annuum]
MIGDHHLKAQHLITPRAQEYARNTYFEPTIHQDRTQKLVDSLDDEIDSPRENDLCPSSASTYKLTKKTRVVIVLVKMILIVVLWLPVMVYIKDAMAQQKGTYSVQSRHLHLVCAGPAPDLTLSKFHLTLHLGGQFSWVDCEEVYVSSSYKAPRCGSAQCSLVRATDGYGSCSSSQPRLGCTNNTCSQLLPDNPIIRFVMSGTLASDIILVQSSYGEYPSRNVSNPNFLFVCGSTPLLEALPRGVTGFASLSRTSVVLFSDGPYFFLPNKEFSNDVFTYTPLFINPISTAIGFNPGTRVAPIAPFSACFNSSNIASTRVGPAVPPIDLVLQNENVVWRIFGANSMVQASENILCLGVVDVGLEPRTAVVIGGHTIENNLLQFDLAISRLGFASSILSRQTTCANFNFNLVI